MESQSMETRIGDGDDEDISFPSQQIWLSNMSQKLQHSPKSVEGEPLHI